MSEVEPEFTSKTMFYWDLQNNLQIMADQKTIVGVQFSEGEELDDIFLDHSNIVMEDITSLKKG